VVAYIKRFFVEARNKVTTWWLAFTILFNEAVNNFDSVAGILPHAVVAHKTQIVSAMAAVGVWTRVRRLIRAQPVLVQPAKPPGT